MDAKTMSGKELYERRLRLKAERLLRREELEIERMDDQDFGELMMASLASSMDRIATALEAIAQNDPARSPAAAFDRGDR